MTIERTPPAEIGHGFVWSRWTARPVEHVRSDAQYVGETLCGRSLVPELAYLSPRPSGRGTLCTRCQGRARKATAT